MVAGCSNVKVPLPKSDSTPPVLVWNVMNLLSHEKYDYLGSPTIDVKHGDIYQVILKAWDPEGVASIKMVPDCSYSCMPVLPGGENVIKAKLCGLSVPMIQNLAPDSDGNVLTSIFLIDQLQFTMVCTQAGYMFTGAIVKRTGEASNYKGGTTTEVLTFHVTP